MKVRITNKNKKIIAGVGVVAGIGVIALFLRNKLGFSTGKPPIAGDQWRSAASSGRVRTVRASVQQLQDQHKREVEKAQNLADSKERREASDAASEWSRREAIWEKNINAINAARP